MSMRVGKAMRVVVRPKRWITIPVPKRENRKDMELVVCGDRRKIYKDKIIATKYDQKIIHIICKPTITLITLYKD